MGKSVITIIIAIMFIFSACSVFAKADKEKIAETLANVKQAAMQNCKTEEINSNGYKFDYTVCDDYVTVQDKGTGWIYKFASGLIYSKSQELMVVYGIGNGHQNDVIRAAAYKIPRDEFADLQDDIKTSPEMLAKFGFTFGLYVDFMRVSRSGYIATRKDQELITKQNNFYKDKDVQAFKKLRDSTSFAGNDLIALFLSATDGAFLHALKNNSTPLYLEIGSKSYRSQDVLDSMIFLLEKNKQTKLLNKIVAISKISGYGNKLIHCLWFGGNICKQLPQADLLTANQILKGE